MENNSYRKEKLLHLKDILHEETDDQHGLTMPQLIAKLNTRGIKAERKALYDDIKALISYGVDVIKRGEGRASEYAIGQRTFEIPELLLLIDAVQSSRFLTEKKSNTLITKLRNFCSCYQAELLDKSMHVEGRIKTQNESIYYNVDAIQEAIQLGKKITFQYFAYGLNKQEALRQEGKHYLENPVELVYKNDCYYLISYNEKHEDFVRYRVDRMFKICKTEEDVPSIHCIQDFDVDAFSLRSFGMFDGEEIKVDLIVDRSIISSMIDRFGKDTLVFFIDDTSAKVHVHILKSKVFFGWIAQFGDKIVIDKPKSLAKEYQDYLEGILNKYR